MSSTFYTLINITRIKENSTASLTLDGKNVLTDNSIIFNRLHNTLPLALFSFTFTFVSTESQSH